ncbi:unnamed protein product [Heligmosomoides polygyrus]|uniref:Uncharacterized protein n=1 Tax=Heligmosomoides polygyrus TaxID=6339 RepID=A0A183GJV1_HELPZ|nr:unnamed protein product [Heligmosomoides polygyrus]
MDGESVGKLTSIALKRPRGRPPERSVPSGPEKKASGTWSTTPGDDHLTAGVNNRWTTTRRVQPQKN